MINVFDQGRAAECWWPQTNGSALPLAASCTCLHSSITRCTSWRSSNAPVSPTTLGWPARCIIICTSRCTSVQHSKRRSRVIGSPMKGSCVNGASSRAVKPLAVFMPTVLIHAKLWPAPCATHSGACTQSLRLAPERTECAPRSQRPAYCLHARLEGSGQQAWAPTSHVLRAGQLAFGDGLAGQLLPRLLVCDQPTVRASKPPSSKL